MPNTASTEDGQCSTLPQLKTDNAKAWRSVHLCLDDEADKGNHGQAAILELLSLHLLIRSMERESASAWSRRMWMQALCLTQAARRNHLEVALGEAEGVENAAWVAQLRVGHLVALEDRVLQ